MSLYSLQIPTAVEPKLRGVRVLVSHNSEAKNCQKVYRISIMQIQHWGRGGGGCYSLELRIVVMSEQFILECGWVPHRCGVGSGYMSI